jgi:hypothetical protein
LPVARKCAEAKNDCKSGRQDKAFHGAPSV